MITAMYTWLCSKTIIKLSNIYSITHFEIKKKWLRMHEHEMV